MWNWSPSVPCVRASQGWLESCFPSPCAVFCNPLWVENRAYMSPVPGWFDGLQESHQPARAHVGTTWRDNHCRPRGLRSISVAFFSNYLFLAVLALCLCFFFLFFIYLFFKFYFIFKLYNIVLVLPYINMNPPQVYTCSPSWTLLPPPSPYHTSGSSQCTSPKHPVSCIEPGLATRCIYDIIHVLMPVSQIIPPSSSPTESKMLFYTSVSLLLSCIQGYCYHLSKFHIYALVYCIGIFLSGLLYSV